MAIAGRHERGEGRFGAFVGLMVLALTVYLGFKVVPVMVRAYEFRDYLEEQARFAALRGKEEEVRKRILRKAEDLDLPVRGRDVRLHRGNGRYDIKVRYTVPIETPLYTYRWDFNEAQSAPLF
ncbi:MAG: hypothetical protein ACE5JH_06660 [Acidobacteriota bacterium]